MQLTLIVRGTLCVAVALLNFQALAQSDSDSRPCLAGQFEPRGLLPNRHFGWTVAIDGERALIGCESLHAAVDSVLDVRRDQATGKWKTVDRLVAPDGRGIGFGGAIAIDGDHAIIGAPYDQQAAPNAGAAYAFRFDRAIDRWVFQSKLFANEAAANDHFGSVIDCNGTILVIGAYHQFDHPHGEAYVFRFDAQSLTWQQTQRIKQEIPPPWEVHSAHAIAVDQDTLLITTTLSHDYEPGPEYVSVFEFDQPSDEWIEATRLSVNSGPFAFGLGLDVTGDQAVVAGWNMAPAVFLYSRENGSWNLDQTISFPDSLMTYFAVTPWVCIDHDRIAVGNAWRQDSSGEIVGAVEILSKEPNTMTWRHDRTIWPPAEGASGLAFGHSVRLTGSTLMTGAVDVIVDPKPISGRAFVFELDDVECQSTADAHARAVEIPDLLQVIDGWGVCPHSVAPCRGDADRSGEVNAADLLLVLNRWRR